MNSEPLRLSRLNRAYPAEATEAAFLLGGIGTGNVSVGSRGELRDWEIQNSPNKGFVFPSTYFALWLGVEGEAPTARVLESRLRPPYRGQSGIRNQQAGFPRFQESVLRGEYPFVQVELTDPDLPLRVTMEAFTPFVPLNADDSGIPGAIIRYRVTNTGVRPAEVAVAGSLANMAGFTGLNGIGKRQFADETITEYRETDGFYGCFLRPATLAPSHRDYGDLSLAVTGSSLHDRAGAWRLAAATPSNGLLESGGFWNDFRHDGRLDVTPGDEEPQRVKRTSLGVAHAGAGGPLAPGESRQFEFVVTWYYPNRPKCWQAGPPDQQCCEETVRNYYSTRFADSWDAAQYLIAELPRLEKQSRDFHRAFFSSTLPEEVLDAASANLTVLRSPTCFRLEDGTFAGWEGCNDEKGCCAGSCTHVWNYAQSVAFLFPELEQSMRRVEFGKETDSEGNMAFRANSIFDLPRWKFHPAADGQLGTIVRLYRDWKLSGNDELVRSLWSGVSRALDFAFAYWDTDGDFVLDSQQHNTYDIEFYGPNSLANSLFYAALAAGAEMADLVGDTGHAATFRAALQEGSRRMDEMLWGGEWYTQKLDDVNAEPHQYGDGCLSDQVFGQMLAHVAGLGYVLPRDHIRAAVESVYRSNFRRRMSDEPALTGRIYALNDESGLLLCSWPNGGRPKKPFFYSDEVWPGIEYQVAAHLMYEGFVDEGLTIVRGVRDRHNGYNRNPWNECECGHHYVRSMASWALLLALSGYRYDLTGRGAAGRPWISFSPRVNEHDFSSFFSTGNCWGIYRQQRDATGRVSGSVEVLYGELGDVKVLAAPDNGEPAE